MSAMSKFEVKTRMDFAGEEGERISIEMEVAGRAKGSRRSRGTISWQISS